MMPMFCGMTWEMRDRIPEVETLDVAADIAGDGGDGGDVGGKGIALGPEYGLRNNCEKMVVYPLAGERFTGDRSNFTYLGTLTVDYSGSVKFMQLPVVGDDEFVRAWEGKR